MAKFKPPTQADVAKIAGVSRATVSYVLNGVHQRVSISEGTRQRVLEAIEQLGYEPNARAQSLRRGRTDTIGVLFPTLQNPYFGQLLNGVLEEAQTAGYSVYVSHSSLDPKHGTHCLKELAQQRVDGLILIIGFTPMTPEILEQLRDSRRPIVKITSTPSSFDHVLNGYTNSTRALMDYLLNLGHNKIGFVYGVAEETQGHDRLLMYRRVLKETGQQDDASLVAKCGPTMEDSYQAACRLLDRADPPTALLVINDLLATAVLRAAADLSLHVPEDVSVAGFDDIPFGRYTIPCLTTVSSQPEENGRAAVRLLLKRLTELNAPRQRVTFDAELIIRESTGPPRKEAPSRSIS